MNVQQHERIARIKQISGYLYVCLTWIRYVLWLVWPLIALIFFMGDKVNFTIGSTQLDDVELSLFLRLAIVTIASAFLFLTLKLIHHFRALIKHFAEGDIFNKKRYRSCTQGTAQWAGDLRTLYGQCTSKLAL